MKRFIRLLLSVPSVCLLVGIVAVLGALSGDRAALYGRGFHGGGGHFGGGHFAGGGAHFSGSARGGRHFTGSHFGGGSGSFGHGSIRHSAPSFGGGGRIGGSSQHRFNQLAHGHTGNVKNNLKGLQNNRWNNINHTVNNAQDNRWGHINNTINHIHDERWHNWHDYWHGYYARRGLALAIGATIAVLPRYYSPIVCGSDNYWYSGGVFYSSVGGAYRVALAPTSCECVVPVLPPVYETVYLGTVPYYYHGGTYYQATTELPSFPKGSDGGKAAAPDPDAKGNYKVIAPPLDATVKTLPIGAKISKVSGKTYYVYNGAWYKPYHSGSDVVYMVVKKPS
jgi:hypothetical protein